MSPPDKLLAHIPAAQEGVDEAYLQRRSVWETRISVLISLTVTFGLMAGAVLVSLWYTRGQSAVVTPA